MKCDSPPLGSDGPTSHAYPQSQRTMSPLADSGVWSRRPMDNAGMPATTVAFVTIGALSPLVAKAGEIPALRRQSLAPDTCAVTYVTGLENQSRFSGSFAVENDSETATSPSANVQTVCVGLTSTDFCGMAGTSSGAAPHNRHVLPPDSRMMESGCRAPLQCVVSVSVSLSAALHTEKNGSTCTSGTAGGRNAAKVGSDTSTATMDIVLFICDTPHLAITLRYCTKNLS